MRGHITRKAFRVNVLSFGARQMDAFSLFSCLTKTSHEQLNIKKLNENVSVHVCVCKGGILVLAYPNRHIIKPHVGRESICNGIFVYIIIFGLIHQNEYAVLKLSFWMEFSPFFQKHKTKKKTKFQNVLSESKLKIIESHIVNFIFVFLFIICTRFLHRFYCYFNGITDNWFVPLHKTLINRFRVPSKH